MNAVFTAVFLASVIVLTAIAPEKLLNCLIDGGGKAAQMALTLFCIYAVWMGLSAVAEKCGLTKHAAKALKPLSRRLFKTENDAVCENIAMNLSCNLLGIGGAATPYAVKAVRELEKDGNEFAQKLLFVINATSVQIVPTTVIALRASAMSAAAYDIFLPSLICTCISTILGGAAFILWSKLWRT